MGINIKELKYFLRHKFPSIIRGKLKDNSIYAFWGKYPNFGDQLTPMILEYYGFTPIYSSYKPRLPFVKKAELISVGTILNDTPIEYDGVILGSGIHNNVRRLPNAKVIGVRGRLTQKSLGLEYQDIVLGDPGLLVSRILPTGYEKRWELGIVPHFVDKGDRVICQWQNRFENKVKVIDVQKKPEVVINEIASCRNIISSSLHGLVTADSYGIPNEMFAIRSNMPSIHDFKYRDYYSAFNEELSVLEASGDEEYDYLISRLISRKRLVDPIIENLDTAFKNIRNYLSK